MPSTLHSKSKNRLKNILKLLIYTIMFLYISYLISFYKSHLSSTFIKLYHNKTHPSSSSSPTTVSNIVFGLASSSRTWKNRTSYIASWWRPNVTKGYIFLEKLPDESRSWPRDLPPFVVFQNTSKFKDFDKHPIPQTIRMSRIIAQMFYLVQNERIKWFVLGDDDTVFFVKNLVDVLGKYDHRKHFYVGMNSECHASNFFHSFEMGFGGGGYALSYSLAKAVVTNLDLCLKRYPRLYGSDLVLYSCIADLGVSITQEKGFHQTDLHNDISGYLSAHPHSPLLSLHHLDAVDPIFPSLNHTESLNHLMKAAREDESRLLQQTICYHKPQNWSFSISFGYIVQLYESIINPSVLRLPLQTFTPWSKSAKPFFLFHTRLPNKNPCEAPHLFFYDSVEKKLGDHIVMRYIRGKARDLPMCIKNGNHSAAFISRIHVISPTTKVDLVGSRRECCDVLHIDHEDATIKLRDCQENEISP